MSNTKPMTPVRACQVASKLLQKIEDASETVHGILSWEERDAIQVLRDATAKLITHGLQPRQRR